MSLTVVDPGFWISKATSSGLSRRYWNSVETTLVTTFLADGSCGFGGHFQTARLVPGLPDVRGFAPRQVEQTVSRVQLFQEAGAIAGRLLFAFLVIRIVTQRRLLRIFQVPGLIAFSCLYFFAPEPAGLR